MKLILLRHAKSSWDDPALEDFDRSLNNRGQSSARNIGIWLESKGHQPDQITCSAAVRARQTCDLVCEAFAIQPDLRHVEGLYLASPDRILRDIRKSAPGALMVVGHNPGFAELAGQLVKSAPHHADFHRYPTAATLVLDFQISSWSDIRPGGGDVVDFVVPRELG